MRRGDDGGCATAPYSRGENMKDQDMCTRMDMRNRDEVGCWNRDRGPRSLRKTIKIWQPTKPPDHSRRVAR